MAFCTGLFEIEWEYFNLKEIFGNRKNFARYKEAIRWNETRVWLISIGCRENL